MAFDWRRYLALADELAGDPREEMQRSSISRADYCVYHLGLEYARSQRFQGTLPSLHFKLWDWFQKHPNARIRERGATALRLKERRVKADYDDNIPRLPELLKSSLKSAHAFDDGLPW
jgi:hypothetical protein